MLRKIFAAAALLSLATVSCTQAQDNRHGRKYKAPPETSHLEVLVVKDSNGKIIENAAVIFHPSKDGVDEGNLEVKSGTDGKAFIDVIPTGSDVAIQVISNGFSTYAETIKLTEASRQMTVRMKRPQEQISTYEDNSGKSSARSTGVQEPNHRTLTPATPQPLPASAPVLQLPSLPKNTAAKGDATVPMDHNVTPPPSKPAKMPNDSSAPLGSTVDGTAASSPSHP